MRGPRARAITPTQAAYLADLDTELRVANTTDHDRAEDRRRKAGRIIRPEALWRTTGSRELMQADIAISLRHIDWALREQPAREVVDHLTAARVELEAAQQLASQP